MLPWCHLGLCFSKGGGQRGGKRKGARGGGRGKRGLAYFPPHLVFRVGEKGKVRIEKKRKKRKGNAAVVFFYRRRQWWERGGRVWK